MIDDSTVRTPRPAAPRLALWRLAVVHVCLGLFLGVIAGKVADMPVCFAFLMAALFAQAGLLGYLLGLGTEPLLIRLLQFVAGLAYLAIASYVVEYAWWEEWSIFSSCALLVAATLLVARRRGIRIRAPCAAEATPESGPMRFGIRHLIGFTLAAAVLLRAGQFFQYDVAPGKSGG